MGKPSPKAIIDKIRSFGQLVKTKDERVYFLPWLPGDPPPADPGAFVEPFDIRGKMFRGALAEATGYQVPPSARGAKDYVDAIEAAALQQRVTRPSYVGSSWDAHTQTLRIAINRAQIAVVNAQTIACERNGDHAIYTLPDTWEALEWADVAQAMHGQGHELASVIRAIVSALPPPAPYAALHHAEQQVLLLAWWVGLFLTPACEGRPVLPIIGGFSSGKTVTARLLGRLYYGRDFNVGGSVGGSRAVKDLVATIAHEPVAIFDDLNDMPPDVIDTLCRVATGSQVKLSTHHETLSLSTFKADAGVALTSNRPGWALRDDLMSRMVPICIRKPDTFDGLTDDDRYHRVAVLRTAAWADTLVAIHRLLARAERFDTVTRFGDWETLVRRWASAAGHEPLLASALGKLQAQRVAVACNADPFAAALYSLAVEWHGEERALTAPELYDAVVFRMGAIVTEDPSSRPSARAVRSPAALGRFLDDVQRRGSAAVELANGPRRGQAVTWIIRPRAAPVG